MRARLPGLVGDPAPVWLGGELERLAVAVRERGIELQPNVIRYLNRLSDLLWLFGRLLELRSGVTAKLRDDTHAGPRWSRAW